MSEGKQIIKIKYKNRYMFVDVKHLNKTGTQYASAPHDYIDVTGFVERTEEELNKNSTVETRPGG